MSWYHDSQYPAYVSVAQRKAKAKKALKKLEKDGYKIEPVGELKHRIKIAASFWGRAWCQHLESLSQYGSRLPRGRSYVRNGSVLHLGIEPGVVNAFVQGSELYELSINIDRLAAAKWKKLQTRCQGRIGSLIELLQGKISDEIMTLVTDPNGGLFPNPKEIHFNCSCPDYADMCKHVSAVLYGVGARLDSQPELLFKLRGVDHNDLIAVSDTAKSIGASKTRKGRRRLDEKSVSDVFGIE